MSRRRCANSKPEDLENVDISGSDFPWRQRVLWSEMQHLHYGPHKHGLEHAHEVLPGNSLEGVGSRIEKYNIDYKSLLITRVVQPVRDPEILPTAANRQGQACVLATTLKSRVQHEVWTGTVNKKKA
jgi:hypothetical protein